MDKKQLLHALNKHPKLESNRLTVLASGNVPTNAVLWQYLCELENWLPLEVKPTKNQDWFLVASNSEIGKWHYCNAVQQSCDCQRTLNATQCRHLAALEKHLEDFWVKTAGRYGFTVRYGNSRYEISEHGKYVGSLCQKGGSWWLDADDIFVVESPEQAIEHLAAVTSFGWQID